MSNYTDEESFGRIVDPFFDWDGNSEVSIGSYAVYNVVLKVPIGKYKKGHKFDSASIDIWNSNLVLWKNIFSADNGSFTESIVMGTYRLSMLIEEVLTEKEDPMEAEDEK